MTSTDYSKWFKNLPVKSEGDRKIDNKFVTSSGVPKPVGIKITERIDNNFKQSKLHL